MALGAPALDDHGGRAGASPPVAQGKPPLLLLADLIGANPGSAAGDLRTFDLEQAPAFVEGSRRR